MPVYYAVFQNPRTKKALACFNQDIFEALDCFEAESLDEFLKRLEEHRDELYSENFVPVPKSYSKLVAGEVEEDQGLLTEVCCWYGGEERKVIVPHFGQLSAIDPMKKQIRTKRYTSSAPDDLIEDDSQLYDYPGGYSDECYPGPYGAMHYGRSVQKIRIPQVIGGYKSKDPSYKLYYNWVKGRKEWIMVEIRKGPGFYNKAMNQEDLRVNGPFPMNLSQAGALVSYLKPSPSCIGPFEIRHTLPKIRIRYAASIEHPLGR